MEISNKYTVFFGTVRGVLGYSNLKADETAKYELQEVCKTGEITCMEWGKNENEILLGRKDGIVKCYDTRLSEFTKEVKLIDGAEPIVGVDALDDRIIIGNKSGVINIWKEAVVDKFSVDCKSNGMLQCVKLNKNRVGILGTGGEANDFKLWDVETKQCIFKAKSMGHDKLNLPIPTSIRGISFFPNDDKLNACVTKEGCILLYDERVQKRPICKFVEPKASYTCIASARNGSQCMVGTTRGYMQLVDLRLSTKLVKTFKTFTGSVTSIVCDAVSPLVFSVSLDKFLRVHNIETKELLHKEYLKQSLTKVLVKPVFKEEVEEELIEEINKEEVDDEYEDLFKSMEVVVENKKLKRTAPIEKVKTKTKRKKIVE